MFRIQLFCHRAVLTEFHIRDDLGILDYFLPLYTNQIINPIFLLPIYNPMLMNNKY